MPELPEVQTTADSLRPLLNQIITDINIYQPKLRWQIPDNLTVLIGYRLGHIERRAKYLILTFFQNITAQEKIEKRLLIHLGMSGSLQQHPTGFEKRKHDHLIMTFANATTGSPMLTQLHYHDPRRFGMVLWFEDFQSKLIDHLGIEPLDKRFTGQYLFEKIHARKKPISRPIKAVIMEQSIVVGVGNIYATEALFLAAIHPLMPAHTLTLSQLNTLVVFIKEVLEISIKKGGSTLRDFTVADGKMGYFQQTLSVYGRKGEPCPVCNTTIENVKITQRASTFCPICQPFLHDSIAPIDNR